MQIIFENYDCWKCQGTGNYLHHGTCFACQGRGYHLTKAGKASRKKYDAWREANLKVTVDQSLVGQRCRVPSQFVGPYSGGLTFKSAKRVVAVLEPNEDGQIPVVFSIKLGHDYGGWLRYDATRQELTVLVRKDQQLYRSVTDAELAAILPTLGAGVSVKEPQGVDVPTSHQ